MKTKTRQLLLVGAMMMVPGLGFGQDVDPFGNGAKAKEAGAKTIQREPRTIRLVYEVFSLGMKEAAAIQRSGIGDEAFYKKMLDGLEKMTVKQESFMVLRTLPGNAVKSFEGSVHIYNTEAEPPELPNLVASTGKSVEGEDDAKAMDAFPVTPATPSAFDSRNVGLGLEFEAALEESGQLIEIRIVASEVTLTGRDSYGQGLSATEMPRFSSQELSTGVTVISGKSSYLGTVNPPPEIQEKDGEQRIWVAFVTASATGN